MVGYFSVILAISAKHRKCRIWFLSPFQIWYYLLQKVWNWLPVRPTGMTASSALVHFTACATMSSANPPGNSDIHPHCQTHWDKKIEEHLFSFLSGQICSVRKIFFTVLLLILTKNMSVAWHCNFVGSSRSLSQKVVHTYAHARMHAQHTHPHPHTHTPTHTHTHTHTHTKNKKNKKKPVNYYVNDVSALYPSHFCC